MTNDQAAGDEIQPMDRDHIELVVEVMTTQIAAMVDLGPRLDRLSAALDHHCSVIESYAATINRHVEVVNANTEELQRHRRLVEGEGEDWKNGGD